MQPIDPGRIVHDNEQFQSPGPSATPTPKVIRWIMEHSGGVVKDEREAKYVLVGLVIIILGIGFLLFRNDGNKARLDAPPGQKIIYPENEPPRLQR
jgi:hypothetical protein